MGILCGLLGLGLFSVIASAFNIQVKHGAEWRSIAERQRQRRTKVSPTRGTILDRNGEPLAVSVDVPSVAINVAEMVRGIPDQRAAQLIEASALRLSQALNLPFAEVQQKLKSRRHFAWLKRRLSQQEVTAVRALIDPRSKDALKGVMLEGEGHRFYPGREALWGLIGYVNQDGSGLDGLERALDADLKGRSDAISTLRDRKGTLIFGDGLEDERSLSGDDVQVSLDLGLQFQVQEDLEAALRAFEAKSGSVVVVDPNTGEILAMASAPSFNPNDYAETPLEARRHHALADRVEPGSTMKIFTLASAISEGKLKPTEELYCENGAWVIGGITIHDTHPEGILTPSQVIAKSSNICAAKIGLMLGESGLYEALKRFGFGEQTGLGIPGETSGILRAKGRPWYDVEVASASFGQGISVTNIQLAMAMSAIANGGRLLEPVLTKRVTSSAGALVREELPAVRREVVSPTAARLIAEMMTGVVEEGGTGREAYIPGYRVAGKTATAQKSDPATGKYDPDKWVASFIGFVPAQRPRFVVSVVIDEPWVAHLGGQVAAPVFRRVAMRALSRFGVAPSGDLAKSPITFPLEDPTKGVYEGMHLEQRALSTNVDLTGPSGAIALPFAAADAKGLKAEPPSTAGPTNNAAAVSLATGPRVAIPDVTGLAARDAVKALASLGLLPLIEGSGLVQRQEPQAGGSIARGSTIKLKLEPST
ncbi:MAG: penicillin-binding protein [Polyangiales bacterium]